MPRRPRTEKTVKKNIKKDAVHYFVKLQTGRFIKTLAEMDDLHTGQYLDKLFERLARENLEDREREKIIQECQEEEERRLAQAKQELADEQRRATVES